VPVPAARGSSSLNNTSAETLRLLRAGKSIDEIAQLRDLTPGTIYQHIVSAIEAGSPLEIRQFFDPAAEQQLAEAFKDFGLANLTGLFEFLGGRFSYGQLRVFRAFQAAAGAK
jgi:ATP-dependent DNA helicase RecQ